MGRYSVSAGERTITAWNLALLIATFKRFRFSRNDIPRGTSSTAEAVIETKTTGA
ncbi:Uncharacterised protein [Mycobacteroides abscessus subsp. abscessus]|nr:Uncharacterised protein [Mycobacteroides abscessus subsp. abscessus]